MKVIGVCLKWTIPNPMEYHGVSSSFCKVFQCFHQLNGHLGVQSPAPFLGAANPESEDGRSSGQVENCSLRYLGCVENLMRHGVTVEAVAEMIQRPRLGVATESSDGRRDATWKASEPRCYQRPQGGPFQQQVNSWDKP